jgi:hypothetical protein
VTRNDDTRKQDDNAQDVEERDESNIADLELSDFAAQQVRGGRARCGTTGPTCCVYF